MRARQPRAAHRPVPVASAGGFLERLLEQGVDTNPWDTLRAACDAGDPAASQLAELIQQLGRTSRHSGPAINTPADLRAVLPGAALLDREHFWAIGLSTKNCVVRVIELARGSDNMVAVEPRELFRQVLLMQVPAFAIAHNHPSGDPTPSAEDRTLTAAVSQGARLLGLRLVDHLIIGAGASYSFASEGPL